jgi:hypothetical protein
MILKRFISILTIFILSLLLLGMTALSCFFIFFPSYLESRLIPEMAEKAGIELSSIQVRNIGFHGIELSDVKIGSKEEEGLSIDSILVDYSISRLFQYNVKQITLSGISAIVEYENNNLSIKGLDSLLGKEREVEKKTGDSGTTFTIGKISIGDSHVILRVNDRTTRMPFDLDMDMVTQNLIPRRLSANLYPEGHKVTITGNPDSNTDTMRIALLADNLPLGNYVHLIDDVLPFDLKSNICLDISTKLDLQSFSLSDISVSCILNRTKINLEDMSVKNVIASEGNELPVKIHIVSKDTARWEFDISKMLTVISNIPVVVDASGSISVSNKNIDAKVKMRTSPGENGGKSNSEIFVKNIGIFTLPGLEWDIYAGRQGDMPFNIHINGKASQENDNNCIRLVMPDLNITAGGPEIEASASVNKTLFDASYSVRIPRVKISNDDIRLSVLYVTLKGDVGNSPGNDRSISSSFSLKSPGIKFKGFDMSADIPETGAKGSLSYEPIAGLNANTMLSFRQGSISMSDEMVRINGLSGSVPVKWPSGENYPGKITTESARYKDMDLGRLEAEIRQNTKNISLSGKYYSGLIKNMDFNISGNVSLEPKFKEAQININLPDFRPSSEINLGRFLPEQDDMYVNGQFALSCVLAYSQAGLSSNVKIKIDDSELHDSENKLMLEGISTSLELTDLIALKSIPRQTLKIKKLSYGDIKASDLVMDFQIESPKSLFVEQGRFKWCGGNINIQAFRVEPEKDDYDITLICDRLNLAQVLEQFGAASATGGGTVNGRIPLRYSKGRLTFEDGFLYSTPGGGGKIHVTDTEVLTAGLPPDSPQYTQMEIAQEALKDFDYSWVKMALNSEGKELVMKLQFDGKPANRLPFEYDKEIGSFKKVDDSSPGSNFQGIQLDVNFRLPLDEMLNYKDVLDMIE